MTDILTRLAALTAKNGNDMLPCECRGTEFTFWDGKGTQAYLCCDGCGKEIGLQVSDLFERAEEVRDDFPFDMKTIRYPNAAIERANAELVRRWNDRSREAALIALVQEAAGVIERLRDKALSEIRRANNVIQSLEGEGMTPHCRAVVASVQKRLLAQEESLRIEQALNSQEAT